MGRGCATIYFSKKLVLHPEGRRKNELNTKILFWNIQGLNTKLPEINEYLREFDIILLVETFTERKNITKREKELPKDYIWFWTPANRDKNRGRGWGGELIGVRKGVQCGNFWEDQLACCNGIDFTINGCTYCVTNVYNRDGISTIKNIIAERLDENITKSCIVLGDWNARVGTLGCPDLDGDEDGGAERCTMDPVTNEEGEQLMELLEAGGFTLLNGNKQGDWEGNITHVHMSNGTPSVIDYGAANENAWDKIAEFRIGNNVQSDHFPLEVTIDESIIRKQEETHRWIHNFEAEEIKKYQEKLTTLKAEQAKDWAKMAKILLEATPKKLKRIVRSEPTWWNKECYDARRDTKTAQRTAARANGDWNCYREKRKRYKQIIKESKRAFEQAQMDKLREIKNIKDAWTFINANKRTSIRNLPEEDQLIAHFMNLLNGHLGGNDAAAVTTHISETEPKERIAIDGEDFAEHINKMKKGKAAGKDLLKPEALIYANEDTKENLRQIMEDCINGASVPREWRGATIFPLYKKGDPSKAENYRGISILNCVYKLYASILTSRLEKFAEDNGVLPDSQFGFRKGRSTIDAIYVLNHCVQTSISSGSHLYAVFVDFKAAFDLVDRERLFVKLRACGCPEYLVRAIEDIYEFTPYTIGTTTFQTRTGLKQGCPLSPLLFAIYINDIDVVMRNWQCGGIVVGGVKIFSLAYADDLVLLADRPSELKEMIRALNRYTERRGMKISATKSKVLKFGGNLSNEIWTCGAEPLKEVKSFVYLGFTFMSSGSMSGHVRAMASKGNKRTSTVWSVGERKFPDNFLIRKQMYQSLVLPAFSYGCEIFGYGIYEDLEKVQRRYLKWTLGLAAWTRTCILMDETKALPINIFTSKRALAYEMRAINSDCRILRMCVGEVLNGRVTRYGEIRRVCLNGAGYSLASIKGMVTRGEDAAGVLQRRRREQFLQVLRCDVDKTIYSGVRTDHLACYLQRGRDIKLVARFRLQNEERGRQSWRNKKDASCRFCGKEPETLDHIRRCLALGEDVPHLLHESGKGAATLKRITVLRDQV